MKIPIKKFSRGFGLLEVMISATVIILILGALVLVAHASMNNTQYMQTRAEATYLAQEGIEQIRQMRDTNWIDGNNTTQWNSLTGSSPVFAGNFIINYVPVSSRYLLVADATTPVGESIDIGTAPAVDTFTRFVIISATGALLPVAGISDVQPTVNAIVVKVTVLFNFNGKDKLVSASEVMTNWRPDF